MKRKKSSWGKRLVETVFATRLGMYTRNGPGYEKSR